MSPADILAHARDFGHYVRRVEAQRNALKAFVLTRNEGVAP